MHSPSFLATSPTYSSVKGLTVSRNITMETAAESPLRVRTKSLEKRFHRVQATIEAQEAKTRNDHLEARIRQIDDRITHDFHDIENKQRIFARDVEKLEEYVAAEIIARELLAERSIKELTVVESSVALELQREKELNQESRKTIASQLDKKINALKDEFTKERTKLNQCKEEQNQILFEQINDLQSSLEGEQLIRQRTHEAIAKTMSNGIHKVRETLQIEKKIRLETESFLQTKIEEISSSLKRQVNSEREKQERDESHLLTLLEEVCNKFEDRIVSHRRGSVNRCSV